MKYLRLLFLLPTALLLVSCSKTDEPAIVTVPELAPSTSVPSTLAPAPEQGTGEAPAPPEIAWVTQVGGAGDDQFNAITSTLSTEEGGRVRENLVAVGATNGGITAPTAGLEDILSARLTTSGEVAAVNVVGSTASDVATSVAQIYAPTRANQSPLSAAVACGFTKGDFAGPPLGLLDGWCGPVNDQNEAGTAGSDAARLFGFTIAAFAADGNEVINGIATTAPDDVSTLAAEQNAFLAGSTDGLYPGAGDSTGRGLGLGDALAFRTSFARGNSWIRQFGTPQPDAATAVCTVDGNGYFVGWTDGDLAGRSNGGRDAWISMIDRSGMQRWLIQFGYPANEEFRAVATGGKPAEGTQQFIAVGVTDGDGPQPSKGAKDALIAAFAPDGSVLWSLQTGAALDDDAAAVAYYDSTIYVAGTTTSAAATADTAAVEGLGELNPAIGPGGAKDAFLTAIDPATGAMLWTTRFGSEADERVTALTITPSGLLTVVGSTTGALGSNTSAGGADGFVVAFQLPSAGGGAQSWV